MAPVVSHLRCIVAAAILLVASAVPLPAQEAEPRVTFTQEVYPADAISSHGDEVWQTFRVVDGITGRPLADAEVLLVPEHQTPMRGESWWSMQTHSDADGFVRIRGDEKAEGYARWGWIVVRKDGYGARSEMNCMEDAIVALMPANDVPVEVRDWRDRPVADVLVGFCGGCGHTPDLASARTDHNGRLVLRGIDPHNGIGDLYAEHRDLGLGYDGFTWYPGEGPVRFRPGRGTVHEGVVLDPDGRPVAGAFVGSKDVHRGPWTRTAADGSFVLAGSSRPSDLFVVHGGREVIFGLSHRPPFTLRLPRPDGSRTQVVDEPRLWELPDRPEVALRLRIEGEGQVLDDAHVYLVGPEPLERMHHLNVRGGYVRQSLVSGQYWLHAASEGFRRRVMPLGVREPAGAAIEETVVTLEPLPRVLLRVDDLPAEGEVSIRTADEATDVTEAVRQGRPVAVPEADAFAVELRGAGRSGRRLAWFMPDEAVRQSPIQLRWFRPTMVRGQLVDEAGVPVAAQVGVIPAGYRIAGFDLSDCTDLVETQGALALPADLTGLCFLVVRPTAPDLLPRVIPVVLPERGDDVAVDLGTLRLDREARLTVLGPDGKALTAAEDEVGPAAGLYRAGWSDVNAEAPRWPLTADGDWLGPDPQAGDAIVVPGSSGQAADGTAIVVLRHRAVLDGSGPWTVRVPAGALQLTVRDEQGEPVAATAILGDEAVACHGSVRVQAVPAGRQRLWISAEGRQTAVVDVTVPATGSSAVAVTLPQR